MPLPKWVRGGHLHSWNTYFDIWLDRNVENVNSDRRPPTYILIIAPPTKSKATIHTSRGLLIDYEQPGQEMIDGQWRPQCHPNTLYQKTELCRIFLVDFALMTENT